MTNVALREQPTVEVSDDTPALATLESRCNAMENEMFELAGRLSLRLTEAQRKMSEVNSALEELVRRSGRIPIEDKSDRVIGLVREAQACIDAPQAELEARRIAQLKAEIRRYEGIILERVHAGATQAESANAYQLASWVPG